MSARDALARIRARSTSPWNVADIGEMRTGDVPALVEALEAVLAISEPTPDATTVPGGREDAWLSGYNAALHGMRAKIETALEGSS